jgi:hypothetical protein
MGPNDSAPLGIFPINSSSVWEGHVIPNFKMSVTFRRDRDEKYVPANVYSPGKFRVRMIAHEKRPRDLNNERDFTLILQSLEDARFYIYLEHLAVIGDNNQPDTKLGRLYKVGESVYAEPNYLLEGPIQVKVYSDKTLLDGEEEIFEFDAGEYIGKVAVPGVTPDHSGSVHQWNFGVIDKRFPRQYWQTILEEKRCYPNWVTKYNYIKNLSGPNLMGISGLGNNYIDTVPFVSLYYNNTTVQHNNNWPRIYNDLMNAIIYDNEPDNDPAICQALAIKTGWDVPNRLQGNWFAAHHMAGPDAIPINNEDATLAVHQSPYHKDKIVIGIGGLYIYTHTFNPINTQRVELIIKIVSDSETKSIEGKTFLYNRHPKDIKAGDYFMYQGLSTRKTEGTEFYNDNIRIVGYMSDNYQVHLGVGKVVMTPSLLTEAMWENHYDLLTINKNIVSDMDHQKYTFQRPVMMELPDKERFNRLFVLSRGKIVMFAMLVLGSAALAYYFFNG